MARTFAGLLLLAVSGVAPLTAAAQPVASDVEEVPEGPPDYVAAVQEALQAAREGRVAAAREHFERAHALQPSARTLRGMGMMALKLRRYTQAKRELENALSDQRQPLTQKQVTQVRGYLEWIRTHAAELVVELTPPEASLSIDAQPSADREFVLHPGGHVIQAEAPGFQPWKTTLELKAGDRHVQPIVLQPQAASAKPLPPSALSVAPTPAAPKTTSTSSVFERWWFWTAVGVVVAGGTVAAIALSGSPEPRPFTTGGVDGVQRAVHYVR